jgi:hypothetical protein
MASYYVDILHPNASDNNIGQENSPWKSINRALKANEVSPGDTVFIKRGLYNEELLPAVQGTNTNKITFKAFPGNEVYITNEKSNAHLFGYSFYYGDNTTGFFISSFSPQNIQLQASSLSFITINGNSDQVFKISATTNLKYNDFVVFNSLSSFLYNNSSNYMLRVLKRDGDDLFFNAGSAIPTSIKNEMTSNMLFALPITKVDLVRNTDLVNLYWGYRHTYDPRIFFNNGSYNNYYKNSLYSFPHYPSDYAMQGFNDFGFGDKITITKNDSSAPSQSKNDLVVGGSFTSSKFLLHGFQWKNINGKKITTWNVLSATNGSIYIENFVSSSGTFTVFNSNGNNTGKVFNYMNISPMKNRDYKTPLISYYGDLECNESNPDHLDTSFMDGNVYNMEGRPVGLEKFRIYDTLFTVPIFTYSLYNTDFALPPKSRDLKYINQQNITQYARLTSLSEYFNNQWSSQTAYSSNTVQNFSREKRLDLVSSDFNSRGCKFNISFPLFRKTLNSGTTDFYIPNFKDNSNTSLLYQSSLIDYYKTLDGSVIWGNYLIPFFSYDSLQVRDFTFSNRLGADDKLVNNFQKQVLFNYSPIEEGVLFPGSHVYSFKNSELYLSISTYGNTDIRYQPFKFIPNYSNNISTVTLQGSGAGFRGGDQLQKIILKYYNLNRKENLDLFQCLNFTRPLSTGSIINFCENNSFYSITKNNSVTVKQIDSNDYLGGISPFTDFIVLSSTYINGDNIVALSALNGKIYEINNYKNLNISLKLRNIIFEDLHFINSSGNCMDGEELFFGINNSENIEFKNCNFTFSPIFLSNNNKNIKFTACKFGQFTNYAFKIYNNNGPVIFDSCYFSNFNKEGIIEKTGRGYSGNISKFSKDVIFTNCIFEDNSSGPAISITDNCENIKILDCEFRHLNGPSIFVKNNLSVDFKFQNNYLSNSNSIITDSYLNTDLYSLSSSGSKIYIIDNTTQLPLILNLNQDFVSTSLFKNLSSFDGVYPFVYSLSSNDTSNYVVYRAISAQKFTSYNGLLSSSPGSNLNIFARNNTTFNLNEQTHHVIFDGNTYWISELQSISNHFKYTDRSSGGNALEPFVSKSTIDIKSCCFRNNKCGVYIANSSNINIFNNSFYDNYSSIEVDNINSELVDSSLGNFLYIPRKIYIKGNIFIDNNKKNYFTNNDFHQWMRGSKFYSYLNNPNDYFLEGQTVNACIQYKNFLSAGGDNNWISLCQINNPVSRSSFLYLTSIGIFEKFPSNINAQNYCELNGYPLYPVPLIQPGTSTSFVRISSQQFLLQRGVDANKPWPAYGIDDPSILLYQKIPSMSVLADSNSALQFDNNYISFSINNNIFRENNSLLYLNSAIKISSYTDYYEKYERELIDSTPYYNYIYPLSGHIGSPLGYAFDRSVYSTLSSFTYIHYGASIKIQDTDLFKSKALVKLYRIVKSGGYDIWTPQLSSISNIKSLDNNTSYIFEVSSFTPIINNYQGNVPYINRAFPDLPVLE